MLYEGVYEIRSGEARKLDLMCNITACSSKRRLKAGKLCHKVSNDVVHACNTCTPIKILEWCILSKVYEVNLSLNWARGWEEGTLRTLA